MRAGRPATTTGSAPGRGYRSSRATARSSPSPPSEPGAWRSRTAACRAAQLQPGRDASAETVPPTARRGPLDRHVEVDGGSARGAGRGRRRRRGRPRRRRPRRRPGDVGEERRRVRRRGDVRSRVRVEVPDRAFGPRRRSSPGVSSGVGRTARRGGELHVDLEVARATDEQRDRAPSPGTTRGAPGRETNVSSSVPGSGATSRTSRAAASRSPSSGWMSRAMISTGTGPPPPPRAPARPAPTTDRTTPVTRTGRPSASHGFTVSRSDGEDGHRDRARSGPRGPPSPSSSPRSAPS